MQWLTENKLSIEKGYINIKLKESMTDQKTLDFNLSDRIMSVLEKFKSEDWRFWETKEQMEVVRDLTQAIGQELQLDKLPGVELMSDEDDAYGFFDAIANKIVLNSKYFDNLSKLVNR